MTDKNSSDSPPQLQLRHVLARRIQTVNCLSWSPTEHLVASGGDDTIVCLWEPDTGLLHKMLEGHRGPVQCVAWSPDGRLLASGGDDKIINLWDTTNQIKQKTLNHKLSPVKRISWSHDGRALASISKERSVVIWDIESEEINKVIKAALTYDVAWSPSSHLLAVATNMGLLICDARTGEVVQKVKVPDGSVHCIAWSPDGDSIVFGGNSSSVYVWGNQETKRLHKFKKQSKFIKSIAWSPAGNQIAFATDSGIVRFTDMEGTGANRTLSRPPATIVSWSPDGQTLALGSKHKISLLNVKNKSISKTINRYWPNIRCAVWSPDATTLASGTSSSVQLQNTRTGRAINIGELRGISILAWSPDGSMLASGKWKDIHVLHAQTGVVMHHSSIITGPISSIAWSPNSRLVALGAAYGAIWILDVETNDLRSISLDEGKGHSPTITSISWSPDGHTLAIGNRHGAVQLWDGSGNRLRSKKAHNSSVDYLAWSSDGRMLASCGSENVIHLWNADSWSIKRTLEGHRSRISNLAWSSDGHLFASAEYDGRVLIWHCDTWKIVKSLQWTDSKYITRGLSFHRTDQSADYLEYKNTITRAWSLKDADLHADASINYVSAKIVLVGESNVGKTCLAVRLTQDLYQELGTTHGMQIWSIQPEKLNPNLIVPAGEKREVMLWDMGGQDEYRLVHQLFLSDTTIALVLLDPSRGRTAFEEVEGWNIRLEKQLRGSAPDKFLVGAKIDIENSIIDRNSLNRLIGSCGFVDYYETSAKTGRGIDELRLALSRAIDWDALAKINRPYFFQRIRNEIEIRRQRGEVVLIYSELEERLREEDPDDFDSESLGAVIEQLAMQGAIANTRLFTGEQVLVLQISEIERYAGAIIIAARNNPRGVPAIEEQVLTSARMSFPGISEKDRLKRFQERIVLECVIQLLLEHGICLKHEGLLIFPSLYQPLEKGVDASIPHSVSLYYDFSGAIDNIYSSLIARLALSELFGRVRLWEDRAEFEHAGQGICGMRKVGHRSGLAHLDLFFSEQTSNQIRDLFTVFVEEHLQSEGVNITEVIEVTCVCSFKFQESSLRRRLAEGHADIICPECETRSRISEGARQARVDDPGLEEKLLALKTIIDKKSREAIVAVRQAFDEADTPLAIEPIRILHLSDLHFRADDDPISKLHPLIKDIEDNRGGLGFDYLDYLVVTGDLTNRATAEEFEQAYQFISSLIEQFGLTAERCIIVPGNHDLSWDFSVYDWKQKRLVDTRGLKEGAYYEQGAGLLIRDEKRYGARFENFAKFYHSLIQQQYPLEGEDQCVSFLFEEARIQFIAMNSSWAVDEFFPVRSGINLGALERGLARANEQIRKASQESRISGTADILRVAAWHHPVTGNEKIIDDAFLDRLRQEDVKLCLHGHVHENRADIVNYLHPTRKIHIIGAGSFGAPAFARPESVPRLYNVIEIARDHSYTRVHTRHLSKEGGAWEGWAVWPGHNSNERRTYYEIIPL